MAASFGLPPALLAALPAVRSIGAITGAGVSRASGLPTYRGVGGLYDDPEAGEATVEALDGATFARDPDRTWRAVAALAAHARGAVPNAAHHALARLERAADRFALLTQNVDGLHHAAGNREVIAIHGDLLATRCLDCDATDRLAAEAVAGLEAAPVCHACGGVLRPGAVLFGEMLPAEATRQMVEAFLLDGPDLVIAAGTSAAFDYIVAPVEAARAEGRLTVEVGPEPTGLTSRVDVVLRAPAEVALPVLAEAYERARA